MTKSGNPSAIQVPQGDADREDGPPPTDEFLRVEQRILRTAFLLYPIAGLPLGGLALLIHFGVLDFEIGLGLDSLSPVLALASTLTIALHVGIYNLEKDKDEGDAVASPKILARYRVFETGAILCAMVAAVAGLLAAFHGPGDWTVTGILQLIGSFVIVLLAIVALDVIPEPVRDTSKTTIARQRENFAQVALIYWDGAEHGNSAAAPMPRRRAWLLIVAAALLTLVPRAVAAIWLDASAVWLAAEFYWFASFIMTVILLRSYVEGDWAYVVTLGMSTVGVTAITGVIVVYDITQSHRPAGTAIAWLCALLVLALGARLLLPPNVGDISATAAELRSPAPRTNRAIPSLCHVWLSTARDNARRALGEEPEPDPDATPTTRSRSRVIGYLRSKRERVRRWNARATGRRPAVIATIDPLAGEAN